MTRHFVLLTAVLAYASASLLHFTHNAEFLGEYPNLPAWITRAWVYIAWGGQSAVGLIGYLMLRQGRPRPGLIALGIYGLTGFAGLLHFAAAPMSSHTGVMQLTIWVEAATGAALCVVACWWIRRAAHERAA